MKRILIAVSASAALLVGAGPAQAATSASDAQPTEADVPATLTATIPSTLIDLGDVAPGGAAVESADQVVNVKSNLTWGIDLTGDKTNMTEHDGSAYKAVGPKTLTNAFNWKVDAGIYAPITTTASHAVAGAAATSDSGTDATFKFSQLGSYSDVPLTIGSRYHEAVTYDVAQGL
jgi:hypothetical protein